MALNNSHNFGIGTANINIFQNPHAPLPTEPSEILRLARAVEASHTSSRASYASKCHPTTREHVIADIADWVIGNAGANQETAPRTILWFSGPAGGGKTCIMRDVVDRCGGAAGLIALSYFFSTREDGLRSERPFVATVVHQLTILHPALRPVILDIIRSHPTIFEESLDFQMDTLLVQPLQSPAVRSHQLCPRKIVIAIDGLDECGEDRERAHLLDILLSLITKLPHFIVVVVASRPELDLRRAFDHPKLSNITKVLKLQEYDGSKDIWVFLCDEFEVIRQSHFLRKSIPENWPPEEIVQVLVDKSSGNFILPATIIKHIKTSRRNPVETLNIILGLFNGPLATSNPLAELDALYALILHPPDSDLALMKRILHCITGFTLLRVSTRLYTRSNFKSFLSPPFLDQFLGLPPDTTTITLCDVHSILSVPDSEHEPIKFHHKSMEDYLLNPERSLDLFQSPYETQVDLTMACIDHLTRWESNPVVDLSDHIRYSAVSWDYHLKNCTSHKSTSTALPDTILNLDPRVAWKYLFVHGLDAYNVEDHFANALHTASCSKRRCTRLCQLITRLNNCKTECDAFSRAFDKGDSKGRLEALSRFESETGLYEPLDPDPTFIFDEWTSALWRIAHWTW